MADFKKTTQIIGKFKNIIATEDGFMDDENRRDCRCVFYLAQGLWGYANDSFSFIQVRKRS